MLFHFINLVKTTRMTQMWPSKPPLMFDCIFYRNYLVIGIRRSFLKGELYRNVKSVLIHDLGGQKLFKLSRACLGDFCPPISWFKKTEKTKLKSKREQKKKISCYLLSLQGNTFINKNTEKNSQKNRKILLEMSKKNCITCNFFLDLRIVNCYTNVHLLYHLAVGHC